MRTKLKQWTIANNINELQEKLDNEQWGVVYAVEYGEHVKVGFTKGLIKRVRNFLHNTKYGDLSIKKIAYTPYHSNFTENEKILHNLFREFRTKGTELFDIELTEFLSKVPELDFDKAIFDNQGEEEVKALVSTIEQQKIEYKGERVVMLKNIDFVHKKANGTTKRNFFRKKKDFIQGVEYFLLTGKELDNYLLKSKFKLIKPFFAQEMDAISKRKKLT